MPQLTKLSEIVYEIDETIRNRFSGKTFWITCEISKVSKIISKRWCYLDFVEKGDGGVISLSGVCWARNYPAIEQFERLTGTEFKTGIEITCKVGVSFYKGRGNVNLEILEIDCAYAIGKIEIEKQLTIEKLVRENPSIMPLPDGRFRTPNNALPLPVIFQRIALITAANSDGQRDFKEVIGKNKYGYAFYVREFTTQIQGAGASALILQQLMNIEDCGEHFDIVVIVRGGGSDIDFKCFNDYDLSRHVALFPAPILAGIGHDRNTTIVDLMARQYKTPTEVATFIVDHNLDFELSVQHLERRIFQSTDRHIRRSKQALLGYRQRVKNANPRTILNKGFAIITHNDKIITDPAKLDTNAEIKTILKSEIIHSTVTKKTENEHQLNIF